MLLMIKKEKESRNRMGRKTEGGGNG